MQMNSHYRRSSGDRIPKMLLEKEMERGWLMIGVGSQDNSDFILSRGGFKLLKDEEGILSHFF